EYESEGIDWKRAEFEKVVWFATADKNKPVAGMADKATVVCDFPLFEDRTMNKNEEKAHKSIRAAKPNTNGSKVLIWYPQNGQHGSLMCFLLELRRRIDNFYTLGSPSVDGDEEEDG
ncbi:hypothetical protein Tco_1512944, partial [Tanacetum coccineum]